MTSPRPNSAMKAFRKGLWRARDCSIDALPPARRRQVELVMADIGDEKTKALEKPVINLRKASSHEKKA